MRCFVAIELPEAVQRRLAELQKTLAKAGSGVKWVQPVHIHLTLKFLGEVDDGQAAAICEAVRAVGAQHGSFELHVGGAGCFPQRGAARVLWVGLHDPPATLHACQEDLELALAELGFAVEDRAFHPHLTLGRVKDPSAGHNVRRQIEPHALFEAGSFKADALVVFESVLQRSGPIYTPLARCALASM